MKLLRKTLLLAALSSTAFAQNTSTVRVETTEFDPIYVEMAAPSIGKLVFCMFFDLAVSCASFGGAFSVAKRNADGEPFSTLGVTSKVIGLGALWYSYSTVNDLREILKTAIFDHDS